MPTSALVLLDTVQREKDFLHHTGHSRAKPASFLLHSHLNISRCLAGSDLQNRAEMSTTCPLFQLTRPLKLHMADATLSTSPSHPASLQLCKNSCFTFSGMALAYRFQPQLLPSTIILSRYQRNLNL